MPRSCLRVHQERRAVANKLTCWAGGSQESVDVRTPPAPPAFRAACSAASQDIGSPSLARLRYHNPLRLLHLAHSNESAFECRRNSFSHQGARWIQRKHTGSCKVCRPTLGTCRNAALSCALHSIRGEGGPPRKLDGEGIEFALCAGYFCPANSMSNSGLEPGCRKSHSPLQTTASSVAIKLAANFSSFRWHPLVSETAARLSKPLGGRAQLCEGPSSPGGRRT